MNWDWEKLQGKRPRDDDSPGRNPDLDSFVDRIKGMAGGRLPGGWGLAVGLALLLWLASGVYIVEPDEVGVVKRFGAYSRMTPPGPHYHLPYPVESAVTPKVSQVRRVEIGFRTLGRPDSGGQQYRLVPEESLMLTGDENIVDVQFIVQYQVKDAVAYLFKVAEPDKALKDAAEAAMREVIGQNDIDSALTTGKLEIQTAARDLLQAILDRYESGVRVLAVQLQDVHPPKDVVDAFKDVASAREDKNRLVNEAEAYRNDLLPRARGEAAAIENGALAYRESLTRRAEGEANQFVAVAKQWAQASEITSERMYIEAMESILSEPDLQKIILSEAALEKVVPYLPLDQFKGARRAPLAGPDQPSAAQPGQQPAQPSAQPRQGKGGQTRP